MKEVKGICDTWENRVMGMESKWEKKGRDENMVEKGNTGN